MWSFIIDAPGAVELIMAVSCAIMGLSHILQPGMWSGYFMALHAKGTAGLVERTFALELWPAMLILTLHQVWWGWGIVLTVYGWAQLTKVSIAMLAPELALRGLRLAEKPSRFVAAGIMLLSLGTTAALALAF